MKKIFILSLALMAIASCTFHKGMVMEQGPRFEGERKIKEHAIAYSKAEYFLGFGKRGRNTLVSDAKYNLTHNSYLGPKDLLENISIDYKYTYFLFYWRTEVFITADVVTYPQSKLESSNERTPAEHDYLHSHLVYLLDFNEFSKNVILYLDENNQLQKANLNPGDLKLINTELQSKSLRNAVKKGILTTEKGIMGSSRFFRNAGGAIIKSNVDNKNRQFIFYTHLLENNSYKRIEGRRIEYQEEAESPVYQLILLGMNNRYCLMLTPEGNMKLGYSDKMRMIE